MVTATPRATKKMMGIAVFHLMEMSTALTAPDPGARSPLLLFGPASPGQSLANLPELHRTYLMFYMRKTSYVNEESL
jgi:hypothetical protein